MSEFDVVYHYDPRPEPSTSPPAGVTKGYLVIWTGRPGPAQVADVVALVDDDGTMTFDTTAIEFRDCEVVDDAPI